jgi:hypothetical protein
MELHDLRAQDGWWPWPEHPQLMVPNADGAPPYVVRWLATGQIAVVMPAEYARVLRAERHPAPA